ncbi:YciI family protein [Geminicoccus roseus]|uniref:YciI family protein n=1 Tax=Geminicoccus roseus TaxID=404900 RepID=UPI0004065D41|nr:YciI family protein [Geminicoccus roseus]
MRFMMLMIPKNYADAAPGTLPDAKAVAAMMAYNRALQEAGVLLALDGLHPPSMGARISFAHGRPSIEEGRAGWTAGTACVGGYWMIRTASKAEALAWAARCPAADGDLIELRQVQEFEDFPADVQAAAGGLEGMQDRRRDPEA